MKRFVKSAMLQIASVLHHDAGPKVIYYHDIGVAHTQMGTPMSLFKAHVETAKADGWSFTAEVPSQNHELMICFDDGFQGILEARDFIVAEHLHPTIFIAVDLIGRPGYLTWDEILNLQNDGFIFQSHTWSHQTLAGNMIKESPIEERTDAWFDRELRLSRELLSDRLGHAIDSLCFPAGHFSDEVIRRAGEVGYRYLFASFPGKMPNRKIDSDETIIVPRFLVQNCSNHDMRSVLHGGMNLFKQRYIKQHFIGRTIRI